MKKRFISFALLMAILTSLCVPAYAVQIKSFSDVEKGHWAENAIMLCVQHGAVNGTKTPDENGVGEFDPKGTVTLGTFFAILTRLVAKDYITGAPAEGESWSMPYYNAAVNSGMIKEKDFHIARLDMPINREDMSYLLVNAAKLNGEKLEINELAESNIKDFGKVSTDRKECVLQAYSNGLITGYDGNMFGPEDTMTREQMAMVVCRLMKYAPRAQVKFEEKKPENTDYFVPSGTNKGMVKPEYQIEFAKLALQNIKLYKNEKGEFCEKIEAFTLPQELIDAGWGLMMGATPFYKNNPDMFMSGEFVYDDRTLSLADTLKIDGKGYSRSGVYCNWEFGEGGLRGEGIIYTPVKVSEVGHISILVSLYHKNYSRNDLLITFRTGTADKSRAYGTYENRKSLGTEIINMDMTPIYKDLGLK